MSTGIEIARNVLARYAQRGDNDEFNYAFSAAIDQLKPKAMYDKAAWATKVTACDNKYVQLEAHDVELQVGLIPQKENVFPVYEVDGNVVKVTFRVFLKRGEAEPKNIIYAVRAKSGANNKMFAVYGVDGVGDWDDSFGLSRDAPLHFQTTGNGNKSFAVSLKSPKKTKSNDEWTFAGKKNDPDGFVDMAFVPLTDNLLPQPKKRQVEDLPHGWCGTCVQQDEEKAFKNNVSICASSISSSSAASSSLSSTASSAAMAAMAKEAAKEDTAVRNIRVNAGATNIFHSIPAKAIDPFRPITGIRFELNVSILRPKGKPSA